MRTRTPEIRSLVAAAVCLFAGTVGFFVWIAQSDGAPQSRAAGARGWIAILDEVPFDSFAPIDADHTIAFPMDHGSHAGSPADAWNLVAHLKTEGEEDVGVEISLGRVAVVAPDEPPAASEWEFREFWLGRATLVRGEAQKAIGEERLRRGLGGIAAYDSARRELRLDNWSIQFAEELGAQPMRVVASIGSTATITLDLVPEKSVVTPAAGAAAAPFIGYAMTRLHAEGTLETAEGEKRVSGVAWFEHLWGDLPFPGGPTATDRLMLQFDDGAELSITRTRRRDGTGTPSVDGFVVHPDGAVARVSDDTRFTAEQTWRPARGDREYPVSWTLVLGGTELQISPLVDDQLHEFLSPIWSGMVVAEGTSTSGPVSAVGTLQLQGY